MSPCSVDWRKSLGLGAVAKLVSTGIAATLDGISVASVETSGILLAVGCD